MKKYEPKQMVASSRYQNYFPTLPTEVRQDVYSRMNDLLMEEKEYCDKGNYAHVSQILTSIALYEVLQKHGYSEEEAYTIITVKYPDRFRPEDSGEELSYRILMANLESISYSYDEAKGSTVVMKLR